MRLGVHLVTYPWRPGQIRPGLLRVADAAESAGAFGISFMDHLFPPMGRGPIDDPMLEGYTALAFLAGTTNSVKLRLLVTGVTYRHPGMLAKIVTTLDVVSGGRAELGLGAAWYGREHRGLGIPFPSLTQRFERLDETLQICLQMWSDNNGPFAGKHFRLKETVCGPPPITRPHPRILVGGGGEKKTLRLVAKYADACNLAASSPKGVAHKLEVLKQHCDDLGRDFDEIDKTIVYRADLLHSGKHARFIGLMEKYAALGVSEVYVLPQGARPENWIEHHCGAVVTQLDEMPVG